MLPGASFCRHAVWTFGVFVGLSLKEAVTTVIPHFLAAQPEPLSTLRPEFIRLAVFCLMIVRFYLGAASLFDGHHHGEFTRLNAIPDSAGAIARQQRQFGIDFLMGLLHFGLFSVWSLSIENHRPHSAEPEVLVTAFPAVMGMILLYDVVWLVVRPGPHPRELKVWTTVNVITAVLSAAWYWIQLRRGWSPLDAELLPCLLVATISIVDLALLVMGQTFFQTATVVLLRATAEKMQAAAHWFDS